MLPYPSSSPPPRPNGWQHILGLAANLERKQNCETARLHAYHLKLGALAAMHQKHPCDMRIATIPAQIARTTEAGAIIAQFVTAASIMTGTLQARCSLATAAHEFIDAGIYGLKNFYSGQKNPAALYPRRGVILKVINQTVPECPKSVRIFIARALRYARPK